MNNGFYLFVFCMVSVFVSPVEFVDCVNECAEYWQVHVFVFDVNCKRTICYIMKVQRVFVTQRRECACVKGKEESKQKQKQKVMCADRVSVAHCCCDIKREKEKEKRERERVTLYTKTQGDGMFIATLFLVVTNSKLYLVAPLIRAHRCRLHFIGYHFDLFMCTSHTLHSFVPNFFKIDTFCMTIFS